MLKPLWFYGKNVIFDCIIGNILYNWATNKVLPVDKSLINVKICVLFVLDKKCTIWNKVICNSISVLISQEKTKHVGFCEFQKI